jgi:hypothetical protein
MPFVLALANYFAVRVVDDPPDLRQFDLASVAPAARQSAAVR